MNEKLANSLRMLNIFYSMKGESFRALAYNNAQEVIEYMPENIEDIVKENKHLKMKGIGKSIAGKIEEFVNTGTIKKLEELKEEFPIDFKNLLSVQSVGPKIVYRLYKELNVKTLKDLKRVCENGDVAKLSGFGVKSQKKILDNINIKETIRFDRETITNFIKNYLNKFINVAEKHQICGSYRRECKTIGDIDVLMITDKFSKIKKDIIKDIGKENILWNGEKKFSFKINIDGKHEIQVDLLKTNEDDWVAASLYFTGSKDENQRIRGILKGKGYLLNEYGLFKNNEKIKLTKEEDIYNIIEESYKKPTER